VLYTSWVIQARKKVKVRYSEHKNSNTQKHNGKNTGLLDTIKKDKACIHDKLAYKPLARKLN